VSDLAWLTLEELAARIRRHEVSAEDAARAALERIERFEPRLRAFITVMAADAIASARDADRRPAGGTLHGVPIALKDLFDTAGVRTTAGAKIFADRVPSVDAEVVRRLRGAGAVFVGKTNLHELAFGGTNQNPHYGSTRNPWDLSRIPGGSSGGSAVALATASCWGALGSDTGGSIRIPASLCGIVGLKPTYGRVSLRGVVPLSWNLDHAGPMARTVRDVALLYATIAGHDPDDPGSADVPVDQPLATIEDGVRGLRIAVPRDHFFERAEDEVGHLARAAIGVLKREGAAIEEVAFPRADELLATQATILGTDAAAFHRERIRERAGDFGEDVLARLRRGERYTGAEYAAARRRREEIRHAVVGLLSSYAAIVTPTTAITAPLAEAADAIAQAARLTALTSPFNLTGLPAISVPCGTTAGGLPVGLQIAAGPWQERMVLRVARAYERATSWDPRRVPIDRAA
jgi:aspartyl-tRNA(Asn)/glutamyl-tRNA(Gln) amidotransferase subunit A